MTTARHVEVEYGALAPPLVKQVPRLRNAERFQADADAITRCFVRGYISESAATLARKRLHREIVKAV